MHTVAQQVLCVLHESLPDLVGLDVDLACTTAAADALADADILMASGRGGAGGGSSSWQYVPAPILTMVGPVRCDAAGIGLGSSAVNLTLTFAGESSRKIRGGLCAVLCVHMDSSKHNG
jgi:hypothetical protein